MGLSLGTRSRSNKTAPVSSNDFGTFSRVCSFGTAFEFVYNIEPLDFDDGS
jgi:hypothetical protein